jgi:hypothetical protein
MDTGADRQPVDLPLIELRWRLYAFDRYRDRFGTDRLFEVGSKLCDDFFLLHDMSFKAIHFEGEDTWERGGSPDWR